nr:MAG: putative cysteine protease [Lake Baikal virophage 9]
MTNNIDYSKQIGKMVASNEFERLLGKNANSKIMKYSELDSVNDLNDLLSEPQDYRIILIETKQNTGHWTCISKNNTNIVWFDSYGLAPDQEFEFIPVKMQQILDEGGKPLTKLLTKFKSNSKGKWTYNTMKFQQLKEGINTCGRWVTLYLTSFLHGLSLKEFQNVMVMEKQKTGLTYDEIVCECTKALD